MKKVFILVLIALSLNACMGQNNNSANNETVSNYYDHDSSYYIARSHVDGGSSEAVLRKIIDYIENIK